MAKGELEQLELPLRELLGDRPSIARAVTVRGNRVTVTNRGNLTKVRISRTIIEPRRGEGPPR